MMKEMTDWLLAAYEDGTITDYKSTVDQMLMVTQYAIDGLIDQISKAERSDNCYWRMNDRLNDSLFELIRLRELQLKIESAIQSKTSEAA